MQVNLMSIGGNKISVHARSRGPLNSSKAVVKVTRIQTARRAADSAHCRNSSNKVNSGREGKIIPRTTSIISSRTEYRLLWKDDLSHASKLS